MSQHILGIRPALEGLQIDPCIPSDWKGFRVTRKYRSAVYNINVDNPDGVQKGVAEIRVNGETIRGNVIPAAEAGSEVQVEVTLGRPVFQ